MRSPSHLSVSSILLMLAGVAPSMEALAGDGILEINATCAVDTGCFPGDAPAYPVTVSQPGSYRLTSNLVQPGATTSVISVTANDVSLDLAGFEISGPFTCPGNPASCASVGISYAVNATGMSGTSVINGSIRGTARGLFMGDHCIVQDVRVIETTNHGIFAGFDCAIARVVVARNGLNGLNLNQGTVVDSVASDNENIGFFATRATITNSSSRRNGGAGISGNNGSHVNDCISSDNVGVGINVGSGSSVSASTASNNGGVGIFAGPGSTIRASTAQANASTGMSLSGAALAIGNVIQANQGFGLKLGDLSSYRENVIQGNTADPETQVSTIGLLDTIFDFGSNVCGTDAVCP